MALMSSIRNMRCRIPFMLGSKLSSMAARTCLVHSHATSFGFKEVPEEEKSRLVGDVFSKVASNYDLMNDLMSAGLHRLWKDRLVSELHPFPGMKHLDVAGGTGDVAFRILERVNSISRRALRNDPADALNDETQVYVCDINPNMLNVGKKRAIERGFGETNSLVWVEGDAEALTFENCSMHGYTIAFGIRNVTHIEKALTEAYRVLKRGGSFLCLELSHVDIPIFKNLYDYYSFSVIPAVGELVAGDRESYQYLVESIPMESILRGGSFLCLELSHVDIPIFKNLYDYYSFSVIPAVGELVAGDRESYQYLVEFVVRAYPWLFFVIVVCTL